MCRKCGVIMADTKKTTKPSKNKRFQLVFDKPTTDKAKYLKKLDGGRSFNGLVRWLIDQEWQRNQKSA